MKDRNLLLFMALTVSICILFSTADAGKRIVDADDVLHSVEHSKAVPGQLNYQAYLVDAGGDSAVNATLEMTFQVYDAETEGTELWSETHAEVEVSNGWFHVLLGSVTPFPGDLFDGSPLWLQTTVGTESLAPRKPLVSVAYSQRAGDADHATQADDADDAGQLEGNSLTDLDGRWVNVADLDHLDAADGDPGSAVYVDSAGKVGIGTTSPLAELDVSGSVKAATYYGDGSNLTGISGTTDNDWTINGDDVYQETGSVGIGTTTPAARLDVQGTLKVGKDSTGYDVNFYGADSGGRFFWDGEKMALRAGRDSDGTYWDPDSMGSYSFAAGYNTRASGDYSVAMGRYTRASGDYSVTMGRGSEASGAYSIALGHVAQAFGEHSNAIGVWTEASGDGSSAMGVSTIANGDSSVAIGVNLTADAAHSFILGRGLDAKDPLVNDIENSLMVGFNDTTATLFVGGPDDRVGIGTVAPMYPLDVNGDVRATTYYGDGSNLTGIAAPADTDWTIAADDMYSGVSGNVGIGTSSPQKKLHVEGDELISGTLSVGTPANDGYFHLYSDGLGTSVVTLEPDHDVGGGGVLTVRRTGGGPAFTVDGNYVGTNDPVITMSGSLASMRFNLGSLGDNSVELYSNAISSLERLDEPGVASATGEPDQFTNYDAKILLQRTITCPSNGYVLVIGTSNVEIDPTQGDTSTAINFGVSHNDSTFPADQTVRLQMPYSGTPSHNYHLPVTVLGLFEVTAGSHTFYYLAQQLWGGINNVDIDDTQLSLFFFHTAYGTVEPTFAGGSSLPYEGVRKNSTFSEGDFMDGRAEPETFNTAKMQRELAAVRTRLEALEREMERQGR